MSDESLTPGERAKVLRERAGLVQPDVAKKLGVPISALIAYEKNRLSDETIKKAINELTGKVT